MSPAFAAPAFVDWSWPRGGESAPSRGFKAKVQTAALQSIGACAPDDALVAAARTGSPQAFSYLVARHQQAVRGFLRRGCGDAALADDLAQEAFLTAWSQIGRFDGRSTFRSWLCGIAYRKQLGSRRSSLRGLKRDGNWAEVQALQH